MARWPIIAPYIHIRKRLNDTDGQPTHGVYDDVSINCRVEYVVGYLVKTISKMWLESERLSELEPRLQEEWGFYPPLPPKRK